MILSQGGLGDGLRVSLRRALQSLPDVTGLGLDCASFLLRYPTRAFLIRFPVPRFDNLVTADGAPVATPPGGRLFPCRPSVPIMK